MSYKDQIEESLVKKMRDKIVREHGEIKVLRHELDDLHKQEEPQSA